MSKTAAVIIVGNEVLSGRTREKNAWWLSTQLTPRGIYVRRVFTIPDERETITEYVRDCRKRWDYVIVCGGIGPTPDDVTRPAIADACGVECVPHPDAVAILQEYYGDRCTPRRLVMSELPEGAKLLPNPRTGAPGFYMENVFVLPGIPELVEAMFPGVCAHMEESPYTEQEFDVALGESEFADIMEDACERFPTVEIGSYPRVSQCAHGWRCSLVVKGHSAADVTRACEWLKSSIESRDRERHS